MKIRHLLLAVVLSLGLAGVVTSISQPASAKAYKSYKSIPKVLRGTWQEKSYSKYTKGVKVRWTYTFNKSSYTMKADYKGGNKKSKTVHFLKKEIHDISYAYKTKKYGIYPSVTDKKKLPYAGVLSMEVVRHHGEKALAMPGYDEQTIYFYRK